MVFKQPEFFGSEHEVDAFQPERAQLERDVASALADNGAVDASDVRVMVKDGEVTLDGRVTAEGEIARCGEIAAAVPGVAKVSNQLRLA